ncbi:hypothetical protein [Cutibacterium phage CAP 6-3]|nr:hypothetical protein [Cutibacterium phage CAP 6-3]
MLFKFGEASSDTACVAVPDALVEVDAHGGLVVVVERAEDVLLVPGRVVAYLVGVEEAAGVRGVGGAR